MIESLVKVILRNYPKESKKNFIHFDQISSKPKKVKIKNNFEKRINISESINKDRESNLITIETSDNSGLLASIAKVFFENKISIFSARINTLGERVEDTFEIENSDKTLVSESKIKKIISTLKKVV